VETDRGLRACNLKFLHKCAVQEVPATIRKIVNHFCSTLIRLAKKAAIKMRYTFISHAKKL